MQQKLCDMYEVTFNDVRRLPTGNVVVHFQDNSDIIDVGPDGAIVVGEPYLDALKRYGGGFKSKLLVKKECMWLGRDIAAKLKNNSSSSQGSFRLKRVDQL